MAKGVEFPLPQEQDHPVPGAGKLRAKNVVEVEGTGGVETLEARAVIPRHGLGAEVASGVAIDEKAVISSNGAVRSEAGAEVDRRHRRRRGRR